MQQPEFDPTEILKTCRMILRNPREKREQGPLFQYARYVTQLHAEGKSIEKHNDWLDLFMIGEKPDETD